MPQIQDMALRAHIFQIILDSIYSFLVETVVCWVQFFRELNSHREKHMLVLKLTFSEVLFKEQICGKILLECRTCKHVIQPLVCGRRSNFPQSRSVSYNSPCICLKN